MARILVVDDEELVRFAIEQVLLSDGHVVALASNGREALSLLHGGTFDLVITDIIMPEMDGIELIRAIRSTHKELPLIGISGGGRLGNGHYLEVSREFGVNGALAKPFSAGQLQAELRRILRS